MISILQTNLCRSIMIEHAEVALHDAFGSRLYWQARRSMRFNVDLRNTASKYREVYLNSTDKYDNTLLAPDWRNDKVSYLIEIKP